jgi:site-specific DNA recombinase
MKNVIGYLRVSTAGQDADDKFGLDAQRQMVEEYCKANDMVIMDWLTDTISGAKDDRPQLDRIMYQDISNPPVEGIVVAKSDRLARDINIYFYIKHTLLRKRIELYSVQEDFGAMGEFAPMLEALVMVIAQQERININKRTTAGRKIKAARGGYSGGKAPYGYIATGGVLEINETEAAAVRRIFELRGDGATYKGIAAVLEAEGFKSRNGKPLIFSTVKSILDNENTYKGQYKYAKGEWVEGKQKAIL